MNIQNFQSFLLFPDSVDKSVYASTKLHYLNACSMSYVISNFIKHSHEVIMKSNTICLIRR